MIQVKSREELYITSYKSKHYFTQKKKLQEKYYKIFWLHKKYYKLIIENMSR